MQGYVPARDEAFAQSRKCFRELEDWMASRVDTNQQLHTVPAEAIRVSLCLRDEEALALSNLGCRPLSRRRRCAPPGPVLPMPVCGPGADPAGQAERMTD